MAVTQVMEKRAQPRTSFCEKVEYFSPGGVNKGKAVNISLGGMLIRARDLPSPDDPIVVSFSLPSSNRKLRLKATVVWVSSGGFEGDDRGMGIRFDQKSVEDQKDLIEYIASTQLTQSS